ncbi:SHOCT domain-containing protein, partial [Streptomyces sp. PA03-6a]|nr:SHOCT domain-containing protein [Streptomyces sp. PA03-6a]
MPGLLRGAVRTAVVAGTATAVSQRVARRQQGRWAEQGYGQAAVQEPAAPAPPPVRSP